MGLVLHILSVFFIFFVLFGLLERYYTRNTQSVFRKEWWVDLLFFVGQYLIWSSLIYICLTTIFEQTQWITETLQPIFRQQPLWLRIAEILFLSDLFLYWGHRLSHQVDFLWRFHRVHHTAQKMDWLAAHREHPIDGLYTQTLLNLPGILLGFSFEAIVGFIAFRGIWGLVIHSNIVLPIGPLKWFIGSPDLHHWHHDKNRNSSVNFANLMPFMDLLFGTHYDSKKATIEYGIKDDIAHGYFSQLLEPFKVRLPKKPKCLVSRKLTKQAKSSVE